MTRPHIENAQTVFIIHKQTGTVVNQPIMGYQWTQTVQGYSWHATGNLIDNFAKSHNGTWRYNGSVIMPSTTSRTTNYAIVVVQTANNVVCSSIVLDQGSATSLLSESDRQKVEYYLAHKLGLENVTRSTLGRMLVDTTYDQFEKSSHSTY